MNAVILFTNSKQSKSDKIITKIQKSLETYFSDILKQPVTFSTGILHIDSPDHSSEYTKLIEKADKLLYRAKNEGKNKIVTENEFCNIVFT